MDKFKLIKAINIEFNLAGIPFVIQNNTVCYGRNALDPPSKRYFLNTSCVGNIELPSNDFKLYINEHHDKRIDKLTKFSIELKDNNNDFIQSYHLPSNRKSHIHKSKKGKKNKKHIPFTKDTKSIVSDIISNIKSNLDIKRGRG